jgi:hypothetical protein
MPTTVQVTINTLGTTHSVTVVPDSVTIPVGERGPIQWTITNAASEGWKFQRNGIDIVNAGAEFDNPAGGGTRVFTWNNNHTKAGTYKYAVRVANDNATAEKDPSIVNR